MLEVASVGLEGRRGRDPVGVGPPLRHDDGWGQILVQQELIQEKHIANRR